MTELEALIILNQIPELGPKRIKRLLEYFGSAQKVFNSSLEELESIESIGPSIAKSILEHKNKIDPQKELDLVKKYGAKIVMYNEKGYPVMLKHLSDAPPLIYIKGEIKEEDNISIAIVGTRRPTSYGRLAVEKLIKGLSKYGLTIVSGLAYGIDTLAHEFAIKYNLRTIAVLGNGLGVYYPSTNRKLQEKIPTCGALISEYPFRQLPSKVSFPQRNRIIAALSLGTVVVEADIRSGAMITVKFALELGKDVFAVPGSIFSKQSCGTNYLIKTGAKIVTCAEDIVEEISQLAKFVQQEYKNVGSDLQKQQSTEMLELDEENLRVLNIIKSEPHGIHIDKLQNVSGIEMPKLMSIIFNLELNAKIKSLPGKIYISIC